MYRVTLTLRPGICFWAKHQKRIVKFGIFCTPQLWYIVPFHYVSWVLNLPVQMVLAYRLQYADPVVGVLVWDKNRNKSLRAEGEWGLLQPWMPCSVCAPLFTVFLMSWWAEFSAPLGVPGQFPRLVKTWRNQTVSPSPAGNTHLSDLSDLSACVIFIMNLTITSPLLPLVWTRKNLGYHYYIVSFNTSCPVILSNIFTCILRRKYISL